MRRRWLFSFFLLFSLRPSVLFAQEERRSSLCFYKSSSYFQRTFYPIGKVSREEQVTIESKLHSAAVKYERIKLYEAKKLWLGDKKGRGAFHYFYLHEAGQKFCEKRNFVIIFQAVISGTKTCPQVEWRKNVGLFFFPRSAPLQVGMKSFFLRHILFSWAAVSSASPRTFCNELYFSHFSSSLLFLCSLVLSDLIKMPQEFVYQEKQ